MDLELLSNNTNGKSGRPSILLVHGMWHGAWIWEPQFLPYLGELGYKAFAMSLSNHANSPRKKAFNLLRIKDYVKDLEQTIDTFDSPPVLIGTSMGGFIVQKYLEKSNVPGAILMATVPPFGIWGGTINVLKKYPLAFLRSNITLNLKDIINLPKRYKHILCSENIKDEHIAEYITKINTESYFAYLDMLGLNLVNSKKINSPLMIIGGGKDHAISVKSLKKTSKKYGVGPVIFKDMGHNMMFEPDYKKVVNEIDKWIQNL